MSATHVDPAHDLVGGAPEIMGPWQLELMRDHGLRPHHRLLDLGCGTLRGGLHLIGYLDASRYVGVDPHPELVAHGRRLLSKSGLDTKDARLGGLTEIAEQGAQWADFVLSQSVLNHLTRQDIERTLDRVAAALAPNGLWVGTCALDASVDGVDEGQSHPTRAGEMLHTVVSPSWLRSRLGERGLVLEHDREHVHPRHLDVFVVRRSHGGACGSIAASLSDIVSMDTRTGGLGVNQCVEWLDERLRLLGFAVSVIAGHGNPLLVARRDAAAAGAPHVAIHNHYDVDGPRDAQRMRLLEDGSRWSGLGVADNKGALVARLHALGALDRAVGVTWYIQGEEESGSATLAAHLASAPRPLTGVYLDENGWADQDGTQRILWAARGRGVPEWASLPPQDELGLLDALRPGPAGARVEARPLNKSLTGHPCPFQLAVPATGRYLAIGTNDGATRIHDASESIPMAGVSRHVRQFRNLLRWMAGAAA